ncbi:Crp/Fnr family transcriptional regulator [Vibrio sp. SCSIO 43137]|uniref:Crp/Fnr family transcriptional regulator n=1 Tax=Vibrio sp. SCSIO 43137 TaxID=3021011 RepID=UPI0023078A9E|nr:Crp/Fnr family transcriptional regulator [Vibrio sp. SCSIO 43137]WCE30468.1 Crp/Fnr family transcriptional regulator [Vibrio sp. SCSIO 43137]
MNSEFSKLLGDNIYIRKETVEKNQVIYQANDRASGFYFLELGMVGLYKVTEKGKEHLIRVYGAGEYFGYRSLFSNEHYHLTTRSLQPSTFQHIHASGLNAIYQHAPDLVQLLVTSVCRELGEAENRLSNIAAFDAKIRVLDSIVELFGRFEDYPWTSREIAEYSGTETQTVIRLCKQLKYKNLLNPNIRGVKPVDLRLLKNYRADLVKN